MNASPELRALARSIASQHGLDPALVCAIVEQESGWNRWAIRYEPAFHARYVPGDVRPTESQARGCSWGLMQVMGQVARENGFRGPFLSELCDPATGLDVGCRVLKSKLAKGGGDVTRGLLLWNGGGRPAYAAEVLARIQNYQA